MVDLLRMRFLPDEPIQNKSNDLLGLDRFVDLIYLAIRETETPFVYGILGDWGIGKTSILRLLELRINEEFAQPGFYNFIPIWFNAWEYENEANIVYPMLHAIKQAHEAWLKKYDTKIDIAPFKEKFKEVVGTSTLVLADMGIRIVSNRLLGEKLNLKEIKEQYDKVLEQQDELTAVLSQWADSVAQLKTAFDELLTIFAQDIATVSNVKAGGVRFVLLIDDLDRCLPDTTIALLENIKNHLTVKPIVYVMGLNPHVVYQGIRMKYAGLEINGREYLEKILNYTFYVPEPEAYNVESFVKMRIEQLVPEPSERKSYEPHFRLFAQVLRDSGFNNPRKIKRILNRFLLFLNQYHAKLSTYNIQDVIKLLVIAEYFPQLFQLFFLKKAPAMDFGSDNFNVQQFEKESGVSLGDSYPRLVNMQNLFQFGVYASTDKASLLEQAQDVFRITRMM